MITAPQAADDHNRSHLGGASLSVAPLAIPRGAGFALAARF